MAVLPCHCLMTNTASDISIVVMLCLCGEVASVW